MADYDVKAVAAALRETIIYGPDKRPIGFVSFTQLAKRADELDPPPPVKSRADRIVEKYARIWAMPPSSYDPLRRILKEEGIE